MTTQTPTQTPLGPDIADPAADILERAQALIADPAKWCQGAIARNARGKPFDWVHFRTAASWCALGALWKVTNATSLRGNTPAGKARRRLDRACIHLYGMDALQTNDERTHADVMAAYSLARTYRDEDEVDE